MWYFVYFSIFLVLMLVAYFTVCFFVDLPSHLENKKQRKQDLSNKALGMSYDYLNEFAINLLSSYSQNDDIKINEVIDVLVKFNHYSLGEPFKWVDFIRDLLNEGRVSQIMLLSLQKSGNYVSEVEFMKDFRDAVRTVGIFRSSLNRF